MCRVGIFEDTTCARLGYLRILHVPDGIIKDTTCARLRYLRILHVPGRDI